MRINIFLSVLLLVQLFSVGCSSKYKLFQEDREGIVDSTSKSDDEGLLEKVFPKEERKKVELKNDLSLEREYKLGFQYNIKIIPGDELKIDLYNRSRKMPLEYVDAVYEDDKMPVATTKEKSSYVVDDDGTLYLPILNQVKLAGLTEKEAGKLLSEKYRRYLTRPFVKVGIANKRVFVLGEVNKPGVLPIPSANISIVEVIARSGDFTDDAQKNAIEVISGKPGKQKVKVIDLTKMSRITETNLMIPANSIVYVQPRGMKAVKVAVKDFTPILSMISSLLGTYLSIDYVTNGRD